MQAARQIVLIGLFWAKYARRIFEMVSTTSIPNLAPASSTEAHFGMRRFLRLPSRADAGGPKEDDP
jgi:hypothetical protein